MPGSADRNSAKPSTRERPTHGVKTALSDIGKGVKENRRLAPAVS